MIELLTSYYLFIKIVHISCVVLTTASFGLRGYWMMTASPYLSHKVTKVLPHIIDSILLLSAILLTLIIRQYPFEQSWLTAKLIGLILYILLGTIALKRGRTPATRVTAFSLALLTIGYIVGVAIHKSIWSWLFFLTNAG